MIFCWSKSSKRWRIRKVYKAKKVYKKSPWQFYSIVFAGALSVVAMWFFLHPNSPLHSRNSYFVSFNEIGNLKVGNAVNANGMKMGSVEYLKLTDSCVWAELAVLSEVKIPKDSRFHVTNVGLMGERAVLIVFGKSKDYFANNARIVGLFDMGSTNVGALAIDILKGAGNIIDVIANVSDTLFSEQKIKDYKRIKEKGSKIGKGVSHLVSSAEFSAMASIDSLVEAKDKLTEIIDNISPNFDGTVENAELLQKNFENLGKSLEKVKNSIISIAEKLEGGENTISLALNRKQDGNLRREMIKIAQDAEDLMAKINKQGLDLNVDIF
jgi:phospholipid/cholesterol/gamma-HCH transport system substrate-binding protein